MWCHSFKVNLQTFCFAPLHKLMMNFSRIKHRDYCSVFLILYVLGKNRTYIPHYYLNNSVPCISGNIVFVKQTNILNSKSIPINFDAVFRSWKSEVKWSRGECHSNWSQVAKLLNTKLINDIFKFKHLFIILITVLFRFNTSDSLLLSGVFLLGDPLSKIWKIPPSLQNEKKLGKSSF